MHFRARTLAKPHVSGNYAFHFGAASVAVSRPISTKLVDKFVDYPRTAGFVILDMRRNTVASKFSSAVFSFETARYG
jgi:hypothetical protein